MQNQPTEAPELERLKEQIEQKKALLAKKRAQIVHKRKKEARAQDTRRKILVGAIVLKKAETDAELVAKLREWLDEGLTEERNRALFPGLPQREPKV